MVVVSTFKKGCASTIRGNTLSLPGKVYVRCWTGGSGQLRDLGFKRSKADSILVMEQ